MVAFRDRVTVVDAVPDDPGFAYPNMTPSATILDDGNVLLSCTMLEPALGKEVAQVWLYDPGLTLLDSATYFGPGSFRDQYVIATSGSKALWLIQNGTSNEDYLAGIEPSGGALVLDCSGGRITKGVFQPGVLDQYTGSSSRSAHYCDANGTVLMFGLDTVSAYRAGTGTYIGSYVYPSTQRRNLAFGFWPKPTDPATVAAAFWGHTVWEFTASDTGVTAHDTGIAHNAAYWQWTWPSPYTGGFTLDAHDLNADHTAQLNPMEFWVLDGDGTKVGTEYMRLGDYFNVQGPAFPTSDTSMAVVGEVQVQDTDAFEQFVIEIDWSKGLDQWEYSAVYVPYPNPDVSLRYGSWDLQAKGGIAVLATATVDAATDDQFSLYLQTFDVQGNTGRLKVEIEAGNFRTVGLTVPEATEGRLKIKTPYGWCYEWFPSDGAVRRWKLRVKTGEGWKDCGWFTNGERTS